jgi:hypothetical protein
MNSFITGIHTPLKMITESLFSSGANTPRMSLSRQSSLSSSELQERLEDLALDTEVVDTILPFEMLLMIMTQLAKSRNNRKDLVICSKVSKR